MKKMIQAIRDMELFPKLWLLIVTVVIVTATLWFSFIGTDYSKWNSVLINWFLSPVSALTGCACVVLAARGSIWNVPVGVVNSIAYGIVAWYTGYYGDFLLNIFFFLPTQYFVWMSWATNLKCDDITLMRRLTWKQVLVGLLIGAIVSLSLGFVLHNFDNFATTVLKRNASIYQNIDKLFGIPFLGPVVDATTEYTQIAAQFLMILRYAEQWVLWIATDVISILMWTVVIITDKSSLPYSVPTLVMFTAWLLNAVYGTYNWYKEAR